MTWVVGEDPPDCHNVERYRIIKRSVYSAPCFRYDLHGIIAFLLSFFNLTQPKRERTTIMEEKRIVKPWQAGLMLLVGIAVIVVGLLVMKLNNRIVLALDGVIMCLMAWCFGIPYAELQQGIKETVSSMIVAILILLAVGVLVGTWMASGTVPVMIYYGMKVLSPAWALHRVSVCRCPRPRARSAPARSSATRSRRCRIRPSSPRRCARCR